jgi:RNA polymerase sigma-70 factor (ECF subfamily)
MDEQRESLTPEDADWMSTTHWSIVRAAGESAAFVKREALEKLCAAYWQPLYAYVRRKGYDEHDAADLTQGFFAHLLAWDDFSTLHPSRGRFRAFLLAALNHFLANQWRKSQTQKRGAGQVPLSLDIAMAERHYVTMTSTDPTPEKLFDQQWAETLLQRAAKQLWEEFAREGRESLFRELNVFLSTPAAAGDYSAAAERLQMTTSAVAKAVERLRRRYRELARREIAQTVSTPADLEEEMRYLLDVLT